MRTKTGNNPKKSNCLGKADQRLNPRPDTQLYCTKSPQRQKKHYSCKFKLIHLATGTGNIYWSDFLHRFYSNFDSAFAAPAAICRKYQLWFNSCFWRYSSCSAKLLQTEFWGINESRKISRHLQHEKIKARTRNEASVRPSSRMKRKDSSIFRFIFTLPY